MKHPCFDCTLPACNDQDKKCQLRRGEHAYQRARYYKQELTPELREAHALYFKELVAPGRKRRGD